MWSVETTTKPYNQNATFIQEDVYIPINGPTWFLLLHISRELNDHILPVLVEHVGVVVTSIAFLGLCTVRGTNLCCKTVEECVRASR